MRELYKQLIDLTESDNSFFFKDFQLDSKIYRIFNYRLASYTQFLNPAAIECRGIMFLVEENGDYIDIKSRPMAKFWNLHEIEANYTNKHNRMIENARVAFLSGEISKNVYNKLYEEYLHRINKG